MECQTLKSFDRSKIKLDSTILAVGEGRVPVVRDLLRAVRGRAAAGIAISRDLQLCAPFFSAESIFPEYDPAVLDAVFARQKSIVQDSSLTTAERRRRLPFLVLLDDVICDQSVRHDSTLRSLLLCRNLLVLITTPDAHAITPLLRSNATYCFMCRCERGHERELLWENFADALTKAEFARLLDACTREDGALVVHTDPNLANVSDTLSRWTDPVISDAALHRWRARRATSRRAMADASPLVATPHSAEGRLCPCWRRTSTRKSFCQN